MFDERDNIVPNGDPDFATKLPGLEAFFAPFAKACRRFAKRHKIKIEKYYHDFPDWSFRFRHPAGGIGSISLVKEPGSCLGLWEHWWLDDYDNGTRSIKTKEHEPFSIDGVDVVEKLESALVNILGWKLGDWDSVHDGYASWHETWTKRQFEALDRHYPKLKE